MFWGKKELTTTYSIEQEAHIRGLLRENGIPTFSEYPDRLSTRPERGYVPREGERHTCSIYVKKKDYDRAQELLAQAKMRDR